MSKTRKNTTKIFSSNDSQLTDLSKHETRIERLDAKLNSELFGLFFFEEYKVMKGFIPGKGPKVRLYYTKFQPANKLGSICIVPGYGESSHTYHEIADFFARNKFVVHLIDIRGFGYSGGFSIPNSMQELYYDIQALIKCCQQNLSTFVLGQGLGCSLLLSLLSLNPRLPISGVICMTPTFGFPESDEQENNNNSIIKRLCGYFFGDFLIINNINPTALIKNHENVRKSLQDGFHDQYVTLQMKNELEVAKDNLFKLAEDFRYPILFFSGKLDSNQKLTLVEKYFDLIGSTDKKLRVLENGYHTMHLDDQKEIIKEETLAWILKRMNKIRFSKMPNQLKHKMSSRSRDWPFIIKIILALITAVKIFKELYTKLR